MKIGFLLLTSPEHENTTTVFRLSKGFLKQGHSVEIFLMEDGVFNVLKTSSPKTLSPPLDEVTGQGAEISLCTQTFEQRGLKKEQLIHGVHLKNQHRLAKMVSESDRFLVFG